MSESFTLLFAIDGKPDSKQFSDHAAMLRFIKRADVEYFGSVWPDSTKMSKGRK